MGSPIPPDEEPGSGVVSAGLPPAPEDAGAADPAPHRSRRRTILTWTASITAGVVAIAAVGAFLLYRHLNGNIQQRDVSGLLGSQPVDLHPRAENILVVGSDTRYGQGTQYGRNLTTDQSDTMMIGPRRRARAVPRGRQRAGRSPGPSGSGRPGLGSSQVKPVIRLGRIPLSL